MERNPQPAFKLKPEEINLIVKRHMYYNGENKESEFAALPGNLQRAINREAEFHTKTLSQTEGFNEILTGNDFEKGQELHNALCEYFAHVGNIEEKLNPYNPNNKFRKLERADSEAIYNNNLEFGKHALEGSDKTTRRAGHYNQKIEQRRKQGREFDANQMYDNLINHLKGNQNQ